MDVLLIVDHRVFSGLGEHGVESIVDVMVTGAYRIGNLYVFDGINGEVERDQTVATMRGVSLLIIRESTCVKREDVEAVFVVADALTTFSVEYRGGGLVDGEVEYGSAVAAVRVGSHDCVETGSRRLLDVEPVLFVGVSKADFIVNGVAFLRIYREIQNEGAVAAIYSLQRVIIGA